MKYQKYQNICLIIIIICFGLFLFHFFKGLNFLPDVIVMGISFVCIGVFSFLNSNELDSKRKDKIIEKEDIIKKQAMQNIEKEIEKMGKQNTITYIEKNEMLEKEMENLRNKQK